MDNLEEVITYHRQALALQLHGDPDCSSSLNGLATAMTDRFEQLEEWRIWWRQSHVTVKHLLSDLTDIPIVQFLSTTLPIPCPLALSS